MLMRAPSRAAIDVSAFIARFSGAKSKTRLSVVDLDAQ
jgi:hypothetical protein